MAQGIPLKDAIRRKGILLDTNVLPHFFSGPQIGILKQYGAYYKPGALKYEPVRNRFKGRFYTSIVNVVECLCEKSAALDVAQQILKAITSFATPCFPRNRHVLDVFADKGESFALLWNDRSANAIRALETVELQLAAADRATLREFVKPYAARDRGWADIYTAQTAIDHQLIVLTEDIADFESISRLEYLTDYSATG